MNEEEKRKEERKKKILSSRWIITGISVIAIFYFPFFAKVDAQTWEKMFDSASWLV